MFFLDAPGGTGKTYVENALLSFVRSNNRIALAVASSGIAALLLHNGTTVHHRFRVPLKVLENTTCKITVQSEAAELIRRTDLIVWDEAVMQHRYVIEAVDRLIQDVTGVNIPMGGKVCVLGGDFKQILPVVRNGRRADIVGSCIKKSRLWRFVKTLHLSINMRSFLREGSESTEFSRFLDRVGSGTERLITEIGQYVIKLPDEIVSNSQTIEEFVNEIYPSFQINIQNIGYFMERAILTPKNASVDLINDMLLARLPEEEHLYHRYLQIFLLFSLHVLTTCVAFLIYISKTYLFKFKIIILKDLQK